MPNSPIVLAVSKAGFSQKVSAAAFSALRSQGV